MTIASVKFITSGTTKGRKWIISEVVAVSENGKEGKFSTFDDFRGREGQIVECEIWEETKEKDGKTYKNWRIAFPKRNVWDAIKSIEDRLDKLERQGNVPDEEEAGSHVEDRSPDIQSEEIPF